MFIVGLAVSLTPSLARSLLIAMKPPAVGGNFNGGGNYRSPWKTFSSCPVPFWVESILALTTSAIYGGANFQIFKVNLKQICFSFLLFVGLRPKARDPRNYLSCCCSCCCCCCFCCCCFNCVIYCVHLFACYCILFCYLIFMLGRIVVKCTQRTS